MQKGLFWGVILTLNTRFGDHRCMLCADISIGKFFEITKYCNIVTHGTALLKSRKGKQLAVSQYFFLKFNVVSSVLRLFWKLRCKLANHHCERRTKTLRKLELKACQLEKYCNDICQLCKRLHFTFKRVVFKLAYKPGS